jgi:hypothetical protein
VSPDAALVGLLSEARPTVAALRAARPEPELDLDRWAAAAARLPTGLIHADGIWLLSEPPLGLSPLAPGSAWSALGRILLVQAQGPEPAVRILADLACYAHTAERVRARLDGSPTELRASLVAEGPLPASALTELAVRLDVGLDVLLRLERRTPELRRDLGWMVRGFEPELRIHAGLRPDQAEALGRHWAEDALARGPSGPLLLAVSDATAIVEPLSPYVRDLGHALFAWALENPERLRTEGLAELVSRRRSEPDASLAAVVAEDLFAAHPELVPERRENEGTAGLWLADHAGASWGWAELGQLDAADREVVPVAAQGSVVLLAGGPDAALAAAHRVLLDSGRVTGVALALSGQGLPGPVVAPVALYDDDDAFLLRGGDDLAGWAGLLGIELLRPGPLRIDAEAGASPLAARLLRTERRAVVMGTIPRDGPRIHVLSARSRLGPRADPSVRLAPHFAARLALAALLDRGPGPSEAPSKSSGSRRFRV